MPSQPSGAAPFNAASVAASALARHSWAVTADRPGRTAPARAALALRFERLVDPDGTLPADERARRAEDAKGAHYRAMALRSAAVRQQKAAERRASRAVTSA